MSAFKLGDRVRYDDSAGTVTTRIYGVLGGTGKEVEAYRVRWDASGNIGVAWASDLTPEGDTDE